jgi:hypothetical protein
MARRLGNGPNRFQGFSITRYTYNGVPIMKMKNNVQIVFTIFRNHGFRISRILLILCNRLESDDFMNGQELHSNYFNLFGESKSPACISTASSVYL